MPSLAAGQTAYDHWARHGVPAQIVPNRIFRPREHVQLNLDLNEYGGFLFGHFLRHGLAERWLFSIGAVTGSIPDRPDGNNTARFIDTVLSIPGQRDEFMALSAFRRSDLMRDLVREAVALEPEIGLSVPPRNYLAPWHDAWSLLLRDALDRLPARRYRAVVLIPFCKVGGTDYVAGILSQVLDAMTGDVLVIQTDQDEFARPESFSDKADRLDLSDILKDVPAEVKSYLMYALLTRIRPAVIVNVNSRLAFDTFVRFGARLARVSQLFAYYFCADRTKDGTPAGYPVWYFANIFDSLTEVYAHEIRKMLTDPAGRLTRATARHHRVGTRHSVAAYRDTPSKVLEAPQND